MAAWIRCLEVEPSTLEPALKTVVELHYRHRFDPIGLAPAQRHQLREQVAEITGAQRRRPE